MSYILVVSVSKKSVQLLYLGFICMNKFEIFKNEILVYTIYILCFNGTYFQHLLQMLKQ
jgi:hypothetical protein